MEYSETLRWFYQVQWMEGEIIECLVDIAELKVKKGYALVYEKNKLKAYLYNQIPREGSCILGSIKRINCSLKMMKE